MKVKIQLIVAVDTIDSHSGLVPGGFRGSQSGGDKRCAARYGYSAGRTGIGGAARR